MEGIYNAYEDMVASVRPPSGNSPPVMALEFVFNILYKGLQGFMQDRCSSHGMYLVATTI